MVFAIGFMLHPCRGGDVGQQLRRPDLDVFFAKLESGQPVTVAAIGGSITMHRTGWAWRTVEQIRATYPQVQVSFVNAGVSGTGSNFGLFRLQRDVASLRPDLVFIEYVVNDGAQTNASVIRNMESMVTALRSQPQPPAIVFVQSANRSGANRQRHDQVAEHYGILAVNTQHEVDAYLKNNDEVWETLFSDAVHPRDAGHRIYAEAIWRQMQENQQLPVELTSHNLPTEPLSADGLITDATLIVPSFQADGWNYRDEPYHINWLGRYFLGSLQNEPDGGVLNIPFYGRTVGVVLLTRGGAGVVRLAVDGVLFEQIPAGHDWYYTVWVYPELLEETWHVLSLIPVSAGGQPAKVRVGFLLGQNQGLAPAIPADFWTTTWPHSLTQVDGIAKRDWGAVPVSDWQVAAPFGAGAERAWEQPEADLGRDYGIDPSAPVDASAVYEGLGGAVVRWQAGSGRDDGWVDLGQAYGVKDRGVGYASLCVEAEASGVYDFRLALDYFGALYVNGDLVLSVVDLHGSARNYMDVAVPLQRGENTIMLKVHAGSLGFGFSMQYPLEEGLRVIKP